MVRNSNRHRKFDPLFKSNTYKVVNVDTVGNKITVIGESMKQLIRHPDDLKKCNFHRYVEPEPVVKHHADVDHAPRTEAEKEMGEASSEMQKT